MKLSKPGAGLPNMERLIIKNILVPSVRIIFTWDIALLYLKKEIKLIKSLVEKLPKELHQKQVIIDRVFAIEDNTRQFSINMVLEHLTIAGNAVMLVIETLSQEEEFQKEIKIEDVKPKKNKEEQLSEFLEFYNKYFEYINKHPKKQSKTKKKHPWFIEFNNYDWSIFMFMHTFIHRRQIEAIIKKLGEDCDQY
ncbi:hypothetical protein [Arcobacter sp. LA11]|uniref:hypothetical protein n=1 Tax=Arcobacter sp. LA11 TaxID=1898176 RepID=UPI000934768E|nr:hypothetical protein [Arcobacter sp. LA11]